MSWQLAALAILGLTLLAGMAWYERTRPPSQVVALVAALAALAVAGRVALSPVPNVVPTTDIAILSGYALGGPPGFAVGALAGLISNFWLGQGPWTPWQMAGWGACGLFGATLAAGTGRRLGRLGLAAACGLAGFAFGALMDLSLMVTYGGEQSPDRFLALSARGLPFNVAHALGNVALALAAGPAIARMLERYRERFEFAWERSGRAAPGALAGRAGAGLAALLLAALLAGQVLTGSQARGAPAEAASAQTGAAAGWLRDAQNGDGGYGPGLGDESDPAMTGWVALGLEAAGINPLDVGSPTPIRYLRETVDEIRTTGDIERTILVLVGAGLNPRDFAGTNLVERLRARRSPDGSMSGQVNLTAFSILAFEAAGFERGNGRSSAWLARARNPDGGWGFARGTASDPDSTGAAMQALGVAGGGVVLRRGRSYLVRVQRGNGGYALLGGPVNAQSTAWAVQGLVAAGVSPSRVRSGGRSPLDYLRGVQQPDGHYRYSASSDQTAVWVTAQALAAASGEALPIAPVPREPSGGGGAGGAGKDPAGAVSGPGRKRAKVGSGAAVEERGGDPPPGGPSLEPASATEPDGRGGTAATYAAGGMTVLLVGLGAGWLIYRRRLPG